MDSVKAETSETGARRRNNRRSSGQVSPRQTKDDSNYTTNTQSAENTPRGSTDDRQVRWTNFEPHLNKALKDLESGQTSPGGRWTPSYTRIYRGSFAATPITRSRLASGQATPRGSSFINASIPLDHFLSRLQLEADDLEDYGVEELRDGFFDASFYKMTRKELATGQEKKIKSPFSLSRFFRLQKEGILRFWDVITRHKRRYGLIRAVTAYMIAYILCLVPAIRDWLGQYHFIMVIATVVNHAGRSIGSQIEGTVFCLLGAGFGIGAGLLAIWISTISEPARHTYGVFLAICLLVALPILGWSRARFARVFQLCVSAGFALFFCVCHRVGRVPSYHKAWEFGIPWILGMAIAQIVSIIVFPNTGNIQIAHALHMAFRAAIGGLELPRPETARRHNQMSKETVEMSVAVRDFRSEVTFSKISPEDLTELRNSLQAVMRDFLRLECAAPVFQPPKEEKKATKPEALGETKISIEVNSADEDSEDDEKEEIARLRAALAGPSREIINAMRESLEGSDVLLMQILKQRSLLRPEQRSLSIDCTMLVERLVQARRRLEEAQNIWLQVHPADCSYAIIQIFLFASTLLQSSDQVLKLIQTTSSVAQKRRTADWRLWLPDYPISKSIYRSNPQVRHDRGGTTTAFYFRTMKDIAILMSKIAGKAWVPDSDLKLRPSEQKQGEKKTLRYKIWEVLHELQGFEARFALKNTLTVCLLAIPAWLPESTWWDEWEAWWTIVAAWHLMQPRVGGNLNDLAARIIAVILAAVWGALAFAAGDGNPYVMAVFALIFSIPFLYRFTLSSHPRSGLIGCLAFTVVSMSCYNDGGQTSAYRIAYTRGIAFIVGVLASVFINWFLWPFVARHELRKSLANMLINLSIVYRSVVAKYIYHDLDYMPSEQDIIDSQVREAKLREGFVRIRELLQMTEHEPRLREVFDPTPYAHLIDSSEKFFDHIIDVRQASLYFRISGDKRVAQMMLSCRRDAVATILMNLWVLGGGLRAKRPIPKYLPSAAIARKRLLQRIEDIDMDGYDGSHYEGTPRRSRFTELERLAPVSPILVDGAEGAQSPTEKEGKVRYERLDTWAHFYQYAYSSLLNEIVRELEQLQIYTKAITGELSIGKFD
ncbi:hypothetical protein ABW19_dt0205772 [Dactylella cylindrospora]|nr:hypothetical protein ABW19_dt0205772 [Dactylella cylindrospora]